MVANDSFELTEFVVAGVEHHDFGAKKGVKRRPATDIPYGSVVKMVREPNNDYDKCAIMLVAHNNSMIGYVPATLARWMSKIMDNGFTLFARVDHVDMHEHKVVVTVTMGTTRQS